MLRNAVSSSTRFSHLSRRLQPGEGIPPMPSMFEQLSACQLELSRRESWEDTESDEYVGAEDDEE